MFFFSFNFYHLLLLVLQRWIFQSAWSLFIGAIFRLILLQITKKKRFLLTRSRAADNCGRHACWKTQIWQTLIDGRWSEAEIVEFCFGQIPPCDECPTVLLLMGGSHIATITGCFDHLVKWYRSIERSDNGPVFVAPITLPFVQIPFPLITYLVLDNVFTCPDNNLAR